MASVKTGLTLFVVTMLLFFLVYYLFSTDGNFSEMQYFNVSVLMSSFLLPLIFVGFAFFNVYKHAKKKVLGFRETWRLAFIPMFVGGLLSLSLIFVFFNTAGSWAEDSLQRGWHELMTANPNPEFMEKNGELVEKMIDLNVNMFSFKVFFLAFSFILFFYFLISTIFAVFIKNRQF